MVFTGFSTDRLIGLPSELFSEVLPAITLSSEMKVMLHVFYRLSKQRGTPRRVSWEELAHDRILQEGLRSISKTRSPEELLDEGLSAAVQRTALLHIALPGEGRIINWYLVNTPLNREWVTQARQTQSVVPPNPIIDDEQYGTLLALYEQNIGLVTPMLADELREAEEQYPRVWIEEAMREAVRSNVRSWRYIRKVLERWAIDGRRDEAHRSARPIKFEEYANGQFGGLFRRGSDESDL